MNVNVKGITYDAWSDINIDINMDINIDINILYICSVLHSIYIERGIGQFTNVKYV